MNEEKIKEKKEFFERMTKKYSHLFKNRDDPKQSLTCFGFEHSNGWNHLIEGLLEAINWRVKNEKLIDFNIVQIKEKFARLRIYAHGADDYIQGMISSVESVSGYTCEECGSPGKIDEDYGWLKTLCPSCKLARDKKYLKKASEFKSKMRNTND